MVDLGGFTYYVGKVYIFKHRHVTTSTGYDVRNLPSGEEWPSYSNGSLEAVVHGHVVDGTELPLRESRDEPS